MPERRRRLFGDERGAVVVLAALAMPVLIGAMGLAAEVSYWFMHQRAMQNAADAAAIAAATNGSSAYGSEAQAVASRFGFTNGNGNMTVVATNPQTATNCTQNCYTVTVADKVPLFLGKVVGYVGNTTVNSQDMTALSATAVATKAAAYPYCILALNGSVTQDLVTNGAPKSNLTGCNVMANSGANCHGHNLGAPVGDAHGTNSGCGIIENSNVPAVTDPYAGLASNIPSNTCGGSYPGTQWGGSGSSTLNLSGNTVICGELTVSNTVTINASNNAVLVIENGQLNITKNSMLQTAANSGLTIVFTGDQNNATYQHNPTGGGTLDIAAPSSGPWSGMALYQDPNLVDNSGNLDISAAGNSPTWNISGMVYFPNANVTLSGAVNKSTNGAQCFGMTVGSLTINGTGDIFQNPGDSAACKTAGLTLPSRLVGKLVN